MNKNVVPTRIQSRLSRKNIKVSLGEIKDVLIQTAVDADNPTDAEVDAVTQYFINQAAKPTIYHEDEIQANALDLDVTEEAIAPTQIDEQLRIEEKFHQPKSQIIKSQAQALGIILNDAEIIQIASNLNESSDELHDSLDDIKSAIIAFVRYKSSLDAQKIDDVIDEINNVVADEFDSNSQRLTQGLQSINQNMQSQSSDFKRKVAATISAFKILSTAG